MANGFRPPSIVGQGALSAPRDSGDPIGKYYDKAKKAAEWGSEHAEKQRQFNETLLSKAVDQNIRMKWLKAQHRKDAIEQYNEIEEPELDFDGKDGWYKENYPNVETEFSDQKIQDAYKNYTNTMNQAGKDPNVAHATIINPFTGLADDIQGGWDQTLGQGGLGITGSGGLLSQTYAGGKKLGSQGIGALAKLFGQQDGGYFPGKRTGDKNMAMVEDGEYVLNRNAVKKLGKSFLDRVNYEDAPRFQQGGFTGGMGPMPGQAQIMRPGSPDISGWTDKAKAEEEEAPDVRTDLDGNMDYDSLEDSDLSPEDYDNLVKERNEGWDSDFDDPWSDTEAIPTSTPTAPQINTGFSGNQSGSSGFSNNPAIIDDPLGGKQSADNMMSLISSGMSMFGGGMQKGGSVKGKRMFGYQAGGTTSGIEQERHGVKRGGLTREEIDRLIEEEGSRFGRGRVKDSKAAEYRESWESDVNQDILRQQEVYKSLESDLARDRANLDSRGSWLNTILAPFGGAGAAGKLAPWAIKTLSPFVIGGGARNIITDDDESKRASWSKGEYGNYDTMLGQMDEGMMNAFNEWNPMFPVIRAMGDAGWLNWMGVPSLNTTHENARQDARKTSVPRFPNELIHMDDQDLGRINAIKNMEIGNISNDDLMNVMNWFQPQPSVQDTTKVGQ